MAQKLDPQARVQARARALAARRARRDDTRRKILIGEVVLAQVAQGVLEERVLRTWLDAALSHADDRELFNLPVGGG